MACKASPRFCPLHPKWNSSLKAIDAGVTRLEVASFVHPKRVPQMSDAEALLEELPLSDDVSYIGLIMNERGP